MIEHWRISAVYFTCNQVDEKVKSSSKGDCRIFAQKSEEHGVQTCPCSLNIVLTLHRKMNGALMRNCNVLHRKIRPRA